MKIVKNEHNIALLFNGVINSNNAQELERDIEETLQGEEFTSLSLDFTNLTYISSAGLRIVLKLKQKYKNVDITGVNIEVYDILEMTGFTDIMPVFKALKEVNVEGCPVIGTGFFSTVYRLDKDLIIKVFNRVSDEKQIERELKLAKEAFILGVPTAISYDIVKVGEKLGVRFEMLDCMSLRDAFLKDKEHYEEYVNRYVDLLKTINNTICNDEEVPDMKKFFLQKLDTIKPFLDLDKYNKLYKMISNIKDCNNFIHGDCHFKNIMVQGNDFLLIDMDTLSRGHFIFELANLRAPYIAFEEDDPGNGERFLGISGAFTKKLFNDILDKYFNGVTSAQQDKIAILCYLHMIWWNRTNEPDNMVRFNGCMNRLLNLLDKYDNLEL